MIQAFCSWWYVHVFDPYAKFVFIENLGWATICIGVVVALLLGLFYKPSKSSWESPFMEHVGWPFLALFFSMLCLPIFSVILMLIMPGLLAIVVGVGFFMLMYVGVKVIREHREQAAIEALQREQRRRWEE